MPEERADGWEWSCEKEIRDLCVFSEKMFLTFCFTCKCGETFRRQNPRDSFEIVARERALGIVS